MSTACLGPATLQAVLEPLQCEAANLSLLSDPATVSDSVAGEI